MNAAASGLRVGIVGLAGIGQSHLWACGQGGGRSIETGATLAAVCDVDGTTLARAVESHEVPGFDDIEKLLASGSCDAVVIATPPWMHEAQVMAALEAGLHVYCEKPLSPTIGHCRRLATAARDAGRVLAVGFQHRFQKSHQAALRMVSDGTLGPIYRIALTGTNWFRPTSYFTASPWRARWATAGGGVVMSQAIHQVDFLISLVGLPARVDARAYRALHPEVEVEDDVMALLEYDDGTRGTLVVSNVDPAGVDRLEVHGNLGSLIAEGFSLRQATLAVPISTASATDPNPFATVDVSWRDVEVDRHRMEHFKLYIDSLRDFATAATSGGPPTNSAEEASKSIELINAIYLSSVAGRPVELPLDADEYDRVFGDLCSGRRRIGP
jgi:predicted dehydrogenase